MDSIGKAIAGNTMMPDRDDNKSVPAKYISPFSEMVKGIVADTKGDGLSQREWDKAVITLAHRRLNIYECKCGYPRVVDWCCSFCSDDT